jgi:glutamyl-tRNA synthetase
LRWLGLDWDEGVEVGGPHGEYRQSLRFDRYQEVAEVLLSQGKAYEDQGAIRFKVPEDGSVQFKDLVRGEMSFNLSDVEDFVILRSDKSPTYHLASTLDDIDYGITIIARGEDILSSTPKHILLMQALDADLPEFCHLPLLFGPDGKKLSKRHGDTSVLAFKEKGILKDAMINYLCLLGWSPGEDLEKFTLENAIEKFDLHDVVPNSAIVDDKKLRWLNGLYIRSEANEDFTAEAIEKIMHSLQREIFEDELNRIKLIFPAVQERIETLNDIKEQIMFLLDEPFMVNDEDWLSVNSEEAQAYLAKIRSEFIELKNFTLESIEKVMRNSIESLGIKTKVGFQAARVSITGTKISPPLFESIFALGREGTIARLAQSIENL